MLVIHFVHGPKGLAEMYVHVQYGWQCWALGGCSHTSICSTIFVNGNIEEWIKHALVLYCPQSVQSKTQQYEPSSSCLFVVHSLAQTILFWFFFVAQTKAGEKSGFSLKWRMCVRVSPSRWVLSRLVIKTQPSIAVRSHLWPSNQSIRLLNNRPIHWLLSQDIVPPFFLSLHLVFR